MTWANLVVAVSVVLVVSLVAASFAVLHVTRLGMRRRRRSLNFVPGLGVVAPYPTVDFTTPGDPELPSIVRAALSGVPVSVPNAVAPWSTPDHAPEFERRAGMKMAALGALEEPRRIKSAVDQALLDDLKRGSTDAGIGKLHRLIEWVRKVYRGPRLSATDPDLHLYSTWDDVKDGATTVADLPAVLELAGHQLSPVKVIRTVMHAGESVTRHGVSPVRAGVTAIGETTLSVGGATAGKTIFGIIGGMLAGLGGVAIGKVFGGFVGSRLGRSLASVLKSFRLRRLMREYTKAVAARGTALQALVDARRRAFAEADRQLRRVLEAARRMFLARIRRKGEATARVWQVEVDALCQRFPERLDGVLAQLESREAALLAECVGRWMWLRADLWLARVLIRRGFGPIRASVTALRDDYLTMAAGDRPARIRLFLEDPIVSEPGLVDDCQRLSGLREAIVGGLQDFRRTLAVDVKATKEGASSAREKAVSDAEATFKREFVAIDARCSDLYQSILDEARKLGWVVVNPSPSPAVAEKAASTSGAPLVILSSVA